MIFWPPQNTELREKYREENEMSNKYKKSYRDMQQQRNALDVGYNELSAKYKELEESKQSLENRNYQLQSALDLERTARSDSSEIIKEVESKTHAIIWWMRRSTDMIVLLRCFSPIILQ